MDAEVVQEPTRNGEEMTMRAMLLRGLVFPAAFLAIVASVSLRTNPELAREPGVLLAKLTAPVQTVIAGFSPFSRSSTAS